MNLHPKIKMICEEFSDSYEWIENDCSLFVKVSNHFIPIVKELLAKCPLELQDGQVVKQNHSILWYRLPEENEAVYDFEDEDEE
jgi:hypothetical protein